MKELYVDCRVSVLISVGLVCLSVSGSGLLQTAGARPVQPHWTAAATGQVERPQTCGNEPKDLMLRGEGQSFQLACPEGSKLYPVEDASPASRDPAGNALKRVYLFTPSATRSGQPCGPAEGKLDELVLGSTLAEVAAVGANGLGTPAVSQKVYNLTVGAAQPEDRHFCYTCTATPEDRRNTPTTNCSIYVTVPGKNEHVPPSNEETDEPTDGGHTDSGSFTPSALRWLILPVGGYASGLMLHV